MSLDMRLKKVFSEVLDMAPEEVGEDASPKTIKLWDSMHAITLVMALEEEFDVQFSDDELMKMDSYNVIKRTLQEHGVD